MEKILVREKVAMWLLLFMARRLLKNVSDDEQKILDRINHDLYCNL